MSEADHTLSPPSWRSWLQKIDWSLALWIVALKALVLGFAVLSVRTMLDEKVSWFEMWNRWDALHYRLLAQFGYQAAGDERLSLVFYPLYPWLVRLMAMICRDYFAAALIVSGMAAVAVGLLLERLTRLDAPAATARLAVWFLFIFPTSYFLHIGYTESLFLAFVIGCILAARSDRWALAGLLGACAALTRVNGLLLMPALAAEAWLQFRSTRRLNWQWLWIGAVALGFVTYLLLNLQVTGDAFAFSKIMEEHWYKKFTPPWIGIRDVWLRVPGANFTEGFHEFFYIVLSFLCMIWCWARLRLSYSVWMTCNWLLITSTSFVLSVPRYTLTLFPIFILFAQFAARRPLAGMLLSAASLLCLGLFVGKFAQGTWAF